MSGGLHVVDVGTGVPVLAIHGLGGGAYFFDAIAARTGQACRLVAIDLPGTGRSRATGGISMDAWVAALGALVTERIGEPVVILGHSLGTIVALEAWRTWPSQIRSLVLVGGLPEVRPLIRERLSQRLTMLAQATTLEGWGPRVSPGVFSPATRLRAPAIVAQFEQQFEAQAVQSYISCLRVLLESSAVDVAPTVTVPTLAVTGADDQYAPPDDVAAFARAIPGATVEILPDCGHLPFLEQPAAFARLLTAFAGASTLP